MNLAGRPGTAVGLRLVLASASPARLSTLRQAGLSPEVLVSGVDETAVTGNDPRSLVAELARRKGDAVARRLAPSWGPTLVLGCDSMLELDGAGYGKPEGIDEAVARWRTMRGRSGVLHTGHHVVLTDASGIRRRTEVASTTVHFADLSDAEIDAYVATGEPLQVAGAFTIDGLGGAFVRSVVGDHHNVVGISLPLLREMLAGLGVAWTDLWAA